MILLGARLVEFNFLVSFVWSNLIITLTDKKLSSHIWLFQLLTALLASHSINWASFPADFLSFIPVCLQIFPSLCWIISRRWSHLSEELAWKIWSAVRFGIQTSLRLPNDLLQPRISGIEKQNGTGIIYHTSGSENQIHYSPINIKILNVGCFILNSIFLSFMILLFSKIVWPWILKPVTKCRQLWLWLWPQSRSQTKFNLYFNQFPDTSHFQKQQFLFSQSYIKNS